MSPPPVDMIHNVVDRRANPATVGTWIVVPIVHANLSPEFIGRTVIYRERGPRGKVEAGTLTSWTDDGFVFAKFSAGDTAAACRHSDLLMAVKDKPEGTKR